MTDNRTTELREKLAELIREVDRLDIALDAPASSMTLGEYEQAREKLLDGFAQAIAATLGSGTCRMTCERVRDDVSGLDVPHNGWYVCSKCGDPLPIMNRYCGGCGAIVRKVDA